MTVSERIKAARKQAGLTQNQMQEYYGIPLRTLQTWEAGERTPPEYTVTTLLRCMESDFGIKVDLPEAYVNKPRPRTEPKQGFVEFLADFFTSWVERRALR